MEILSKLDTYELIYFIFLFVFVLFFSLKGLLQSLGYSLKLIFSFAIPFLTYKKILLFINTSESTEYLKSLTSKNALISEIIIFISIFLLSYFFFGILEKIFNVNLKRNLLMRLIDIILGALYGMFIFSMIFYFSYKLILVNHLPSDMNKLMLYNINLYDDLSSSEEIEGDLNLDKSSLDEIY